MGTADGRATSFNEVMASLLGAPLNLFSLSFLFFRAKEVQHVHALAAAEGLQQNHPAICKSYRVSICEGLCALLNRGHVLDLTYSQPVLQV